MKVFSRSRQNHGYNRVSYRRRKSLLVVALVWIAFAVPAFSQVSLPAGASSPLAMTGSEPISKEVLVLARSRRSVANEIHNDADIRLAANSGDPDAQVELALRMSTDDSADAANAFRWFLRAAVDGSPSAMNNLAVFYFQGRGVSEDPAEGIRWAMRAAKSNFAPAEMNLGIAYYSGWGVPPDAPEAFRWISRAAKHGLAPAQAAVGVAYELGTSAQRNCAEAAKWYSKAAKQDNAAALNNLGGLYEFGEGVPKDPHKSAELYRRAIIAGSFEAKVNMARLMVHGTVVPRDVVTACGLLLSAANKLPNASKDAATVCGMLSTDDQAKAALLAAEGPLSVP